MEANSSTDWFDAVPAGCVNLSVSFVLDSTELWTLRDLGEVFWVTPDEEVGTCEDLGDLSVGVVLFMFKIVMLDGCVEDDAAALLILPVDDSATLLLILFENTFVGLLCGGVF